LQTKPETTTEGDAVIDVRDLSVHFDLQGSMLARVLGRDTGTVKAVDGVDLTLHSGEVVGLVGESGSGKSTLGRALLGLVPATRGSIEFQGRDVAGLKRRELRRIRRDIQMVFQDPNAALNPAMTVEQAVGDALRVQGMRSADERRERVIDALERVGLSPVELFLSKYPRDLSGGQKQRVVFARANIKGPSVLVAPEPNCNRDMSVPAKIRPLMEDRKAQLGLSYVYITHDLASAKFFCDRIAIMYLGRIVEIGSTEEIFASPRHPYTKALLKAIPDPDPDRQVVRDLPRGEIADAASPPLGCAFHPRCPEAVAQCGWESRDLRTLLDEHWLRQDPADSAAERALFGDLDALDQPSHRAQLSARDPKEARRLLDRIRAENPDEPLWTGVTAIEEGQDVVSISFQQGVDPGLRRDGGVEVACVLYGEEPEASSDRRS
jgi:peptide/nickel transport system ATP-binding protein